MTTFIGNSPLLFPTLIAVSGILLVLIYLLYRTRQRQARALRNVESTQSESDRAFNQIRIVRAGAELLARQGVDVSSVRSSIEAAEADDLRGDHAGALQRAEAARRQLLSARNGGAPTRPSALETRPPMVRGSAPEPAVRPVARYPVTAPASSPSFGSVGVPGAGAEPEDLVEPMDPPKAGRIPLHQVEARFAMQMLSDDLAAARARAIGEATRDEARALLEQAQLAFQRQEYTESWKLGLKGRRRLSGRVEGVETRDPVRPTGTSIPSDRPGVACPQCGRVGSASDNFCRGCGRTSSTARPCPRCGAPQGVDDQYCGLCGTPRSV
ncbi:MAG: zinc ribbon domain-containing protein [Thermoplasmata archaeon]